jgi:hypothetical protein
MFGARPPDSVADSLPHVPAFTPKLAGTPDKLPERSGMQLSNLELLFIFGVVVGAGLLYVKQRGSAHLTDKSKIYQ